MLGLRSPPSIGAARAAGAASRAVATDTSRTLRVRWIGRCIRSYWHDRRRRTRAVVAPLTGSGWPVRRRTGRRDPRGAPGSLERGLARRRLHGAPRPPCSTRRKEPACALSSAPWLPSRSRRWPCPLPHPPSIRSSRSSRPRERSAAPIPRCAPRPSTKSRRSECTGCASCSIGRTSRPTSTPPRCRRSTRPIRRPTTGRSTTACSPTRALATSAVLVTISGPGPRWATRSREDRVTRPSATRFRRFVTAVGRRYGEQVDYWSVWNEPNHPQFLAPQYVHGRAYSPRLYRQLFRAAQSGLERSGQRARPRADGRDGAARQQQRRRAAGVPARLAVPELVLPQAPAAAARSTSTAGRTIRTRPPRDRGSSPPSATT